MTRKATRKDPAAVRLGKKGGARRWQNVPKAERQRIMTETINTRWRKRDAR